VIIVMTTNAGAQEMSRPGIGFAPADNTSDGLEAIRRLFAPEFRNRLDAIIQFAPLLKSTIERVVEKLLVEVEMQLEQKGVHLLVDDEARSWLADHGYDQKMGARPMARLIQEQIKRPLAEELLFGKLAGGGEVQVGVAGDGKGLSLNVHPAGQLALPQSVESP
jgi:ATP-dependent Clp protease ATP-binding subunit ClpA